MAKTRIFPSSETEEDTASPQTRQPLIPTLYHFAFLFASLTGNALSSSPLMTKTELQSALAAATETTKSTAGVFLDTLHLIAAKEVRKTGEFVLPGFGKLVKQKRKARAGFNPKTRAKIKIPAKTVVKFRVAKAVKDAVLGIKK